MYNIKGKDSNMILIIDTNKRRAESLSDIFYYMGILSRAASARESFTEISSLYKAVLISAPESFPDIKDFVHRLSEYSRAPIYCITKSQNANAYGNLFRMIFHESIYSSLLATSIAEDLRAQGLPVIGTYRISGIDASCDRGEASSLGNSLPFTKTELMILRYLIASYPFPTSPKSILKYAFKPARQPDVSGIRTHVSVMNKKYRRILNRNLITSIPEQGYLISTPEIPSEISDMDIAYTSVPQKSI